MVQLVAIVPCIPLAMPGQRAVLVQKTFRATTSRGKPAPELKSARAREREVESICKMQVGECQTHCW